MLFSRFNIAVQNHDIYFVKTIFLIDVSFKNMLII